MKLILRIIGHAQSGKPDQLDSTIRLLVGSGWQEWPTQRIYRSNECVAFLTRPNNPRPAGTCRKPSNDKLSDSRPEQPTT